MLKTKTLIAFCFVVAIFITLNASANTQNQNFKGEVLGATAPGNAHTIASLPSSDNTIILPPAKTSQPMNSNRQSMSRMAN